MSNKDLTSLDKVQAKYIKLFLGLSHLCHIKHLLKPISESVLMPSLRSSSTSEFGSSVLKLGKIKAANKCVVARPVKCNQYD